jgi:tryptophanyl-tRNA synthetase
MIKHVLAVLEPIQQRRRELEQRPGVVDDVLARGAERARTTAAETLDEAKQAMGL